MRPLPHDCHSGEKRERGRERGGEVWGRLLMTVIRVSLLERWKGRGKGGGV